VLPTTQAPAWTYLRAPLNFASSTALRAQLQAEEARDGTAERAAP
jgi:hypothetical protein